MGEKLSQASLKISKNDNKKQLNSLSKVLRPKVYITDSSSFKRLVQELTGNGATISSPQRTKPQQTVENVSIIDVEDHGDLDCHRESSFDTSNDSFDPCKDLDYCGIGASFDASIDHWIDSFDDITSDDSLRSQQQKVDLLAPDDLFSLFVNETYPLFNEYPQILQEVSINDYELTGLI